MLNGGDHNFFINFSNYARELCNANQLYHLATKDDLETLINNIFQNFGIDLDYSSSTLFSYLIDNIDSPSQNESWQKMVDFIEQRV